ncbi:MAG: dethiobiotin synthase [Betaproteobacteria bacterium]|nr:dethiobiotin synthase [Betaproteobacteria bacterium]
MKKAYFVTGTDTNVGKTLIACGLLRAFVGLGERAVGMKPVAAGCEETPDGLRCDDVVKLCAAGNVVAPPQLVNPYALIPPVAPHLAAMQANVAIHIEAIVDAFRQLQEMADVVVVEGVGGFAVPLNEREDTADLAQQLGLPVILVVGLRLGCLNHALLTAEAIRQRGLRLAGWVANQIEPGMPFLQENIAALEYRLAAPLLGVLPYREGLTAVEAAGSLQMTLLACPER